jgi:hypothetical protein
MLETQRGSDHALSKTQDLCDGWDHQQGSFVGFLQDEKTLDVVTKILSLPSGLLQTTKAS